MREYRQKFCSSLKLLPARLFQYFSKSLAAPYKDLDLAEFTQLCQLRDTKGGRKELEIEVQSVPTTASLEECLHKRRSERNFSDAPVSASVVQKVLALSLGPNSSGTRMYPSAGGLYPIGAYLVAFNVIGLDPGIYAFSQITGKISACGMRAVVPQLERYFKATQGCSGFAFCIILTGMFFKTLLKYGNRGYRYVFLDAGHATQNVYLTATSFELGCVSVGGFDDDLFNRILDIDGVSESTIYLCLLGQK